MDITVSRLNQRIALQLPTELPLGLVFVVGQIELPAAAPAAQAGWPGEFVLTDQGYRLPCRLSERAATEFRLQEGDMVRAGGHLVFEPALARYYLLVRDIERLDGFRPAAQPLAAIIADSDRRDLGTSLTPADLPPWIQKMAPAEVRPEPAGDGPANDLAGESRALGSRTVTGLAATEPGLSADWELLADAEAAVAYPEAEPALAGLSDELIAFLSQAMDSEVEVEITSEIMTDLNTTGTTNRLSAEVLEALDLFEASVNRSAKSPRQQQAASRLEQNGPWDGSAGQSPADQTIDAADFVRALESATAETPVATVRKTPQAQAPAGPRNDQAARPGQANARAKSDDQVPWYVALLIIAMVIIILAAIIYIAQSAGDLPLDLSLDLPLELPLLN